MRSMFTALTWEYSRRVWRGAVMALAMMIGFPIFIVGMIRLAAGPIPLDGFDTLPLHYNFLGISLFGVGFLVFVTQNDDNFVFPGRLCALPVPSWFLVAVRAVQGAATVAVLFLLTAWTYNLVYGLNWPILGPLLFLSTALVCLQAFAWSVRDFRFWKPALYVPIVVGLTYWLDSRYAFPGPQQPAKFWNNVTPVEILTMAVIALIAYAMAVNGMNRARRGDANGLARIKEDLDRFSDLMPSPRRPHASAEVTLFRTAWHRHGVTMPFCVGMFLIIGVLTAGVMSTITGPSKPHEWLEALTALSLIFAIVVPLGFGTLFGRDVRYSLILPVSTKTLSRALLKVAGWSIATNWLVCAAIVLLGAGWVALTEGIYAAYRVVKPEHVTGFVLYPHRLPTAEILDGWTMPYLTAILLVLMWLTSWTCHGLGVLASLTKPAAPLRLLRNFVLVGLYLFLLPIGEHLVGYSVAQFLYRATAIVVGLACLLASGRAIRAARRKNLLTPRAAWTAVVVWFLLCGTVILTFSDLREPAVSLLILTCGVLALPLAPFAMTPLALDRLRHQ